MSPLGLPALHALYPRGLEVWRRRVILLPRLQRLKEWAYAGAIFDFSGAAASHLFLGDGPQTWAYPAILVSE